MTDTAVPNRTPILVVEHHSAASATGALLEQQGYNCALAGSAAEALHLAADSRPALLLVASRLPDLTSVELVSELGERQQLPPFIVMTGSNDLELAARLMRLGARDFLITDDKFSARLVPVIHRVLDELELERQIQLRHS